MSFKEFWESYICIWFLIGSYQLLVGTVEDSGGHEQNQGRPYLTLWTVLTKKGLWPCNFKQNWIQSKISLHDSFTYYRFPRWMIIRVNSLAFLGPMSVQKLLGLEPGTIPTKLEMSKLYSGHWVGFPIKNCFHSWLCVVWKHDRFYNMTIFLCPGFQTGPISVGPFFTTEEFQCHKNWRIYFSCRKTSKWWKQVRLMFPKIFLHGQHKWVSWESQDL